MPESTRPNILLITTDQQRYDTLGVNGAAWMKTPHLDALARRGILFHNAFIQNPVCIPSRACVQTGRHTHQHGLKYMESVIDDTPGLPAWETTFMERLQTGGYYTGGFGKIHMMPAERGFHEQKVTGGKGQRWKKSAGLEVGLAPLGRDYAAWLEAKHPGGYEMIYEQRRQPDYQKYKGAVPFPLPLDEYVDYWTAENTIEFVQRDHGRPFFAWCGFCGPHGPNDPPAPYDSLYPQENVAFPPNYYFNEDGSERATTPEQDEIARRFCSLYWGEVTLIDDMVGKIVDALEQKDILDSTLIIFTSDHGEMMFDFGRLGKGNFYDPVIHVPLVLAPPAGEGPPRECDELVEIFDIAPTALDYANCEVPPTMSASASLRPFAREDGQGKETVFCEYMTNDRSFQGACVRTERYKYAYWQDSRPEQFYNLHEDPHERDNLAGDPQYREEVGRHRLLMIDHFMHPVELPRVRP